MRYLAPILSLLVVAMFAPALMAQDEAPADNDRAARRGEMRQRIVEEFDADGDGQLNNEERAAAREEMRARRGRGRNAQRGAGDVQPGEAAPRGRRLMDEDPPRPAPGPGRRNRPAGPPDPAEVFKQSDTNGDGVLDLEEFIKASEAMRPQRAAGPPRGSGDAGPPQGGQRRFDRRQPLQNPDDSQPGPPRRRADGPRADQPRGDAGPPPRGPRGRQADPVGPGGAGPGRGMPDPDAVFDRFDDNGDGQLSREEFHQLADRMQAMRQRLLNQLQGPAEGGRNRPPAARDGRGPRRESPQEGDRPRGQRRNRPEMENSAEPAENDSV